ncbi:MAG: amidohydrolase family protein [Myxococcota bacterium]
MPIDIGQLDLNFGGDMADAGVEMATPEMGTPEMGMPDLGPLPTESEPSPPAAVRGDGEALVLTGTVLTQAGPIEGAIRIEGDTITCVAASCDEAGATVVDTFGVISPGLIDAHNHLTFNFMPEWEPDPSQLFMNRYEWSEEESYEAHIAPFADNRSRNTTFCPAALWGELRSLVHGTTTIMGQSFNRSCIGGGVRNADHRHRLGADHMRTTIASVRDINDEDAAGLVESFTDPASPTTRYAVHMQEGLMGSGVELEFESFVGRDTRNNRHQGVNLMVGEGYFGVALFIHAMNMSTAQLMESIDGGAHFVWSPSSNLILYGETAPVAEMIALAIDLSLAPDWTVSGTDNMLDEMRFARGFGVGQGIAEMTPEFIWRMTTENAARAVGLESIGVLREGAPADVVVFARRAADPYRAVLDSRSEDVRLVLIGGEGYYGDMALEMATSVNGGCEVFDACSSVKFLCVRDLPGAEGDWVGDGLDDLRGQLQTIIDGYDNLSYSAPLPLVDCE